MPTLKDIADVVGVSVSTVSRVLANEANRSVNTDTKQRIWDTATKLGYKHKNKVVEQPDTLRSVGCIVSTLQNRHYHPYFSVILDGIDQELAKHGYTMAYTYTQQDLKKPELLKQAVQANKVAGIILIEGIDAKSYSFIKKHVPTLVGIDVSDQSISNISYDRLNAAESAVTHLIEQGHRKILFIGGTGLSGHFEREKRFRGYKLALQRAEIMFDPALVMDANWEPNQAYEGMLAYLDANASALPTAVFAASDIMAMAAMRAISEKGYRIPQDFAIIGFDDNEPSQYTIPPLSTIHIPTFEIGVIAAKTLLQTIKDPYPLPVRISVPFDPMFRASSQWVVST